MADFSPINSALVAQITLTPASVAADTTVEQTFTVTGCPSNAFAVFARLEPQTPGIALVGARVTAQDTIGISFANDTTGPLTPSAGVYTIILLR